MSGNQNSGIRDFSKYDGMTTEELEALLRLDADAAADQGSDTEALLYIMEVLTKREKKNGHTGHTAQQAYESFQQYYRPEIENEDPAAAKGNRPKARSLCWMRGLVAAAAVFAVVIFGSVTANAFGIDVWKAVIQWTQETFHFGNWGNSPDEGNDLPYASLQDALTNHNISTPLAPQWIPDNYKLVDITVEQSPLQKKYRATYKNGEQTLKITVQDYLNEDPIYVEQSEDLVEEYMVSGITYYIFANNDQVRATWLNGSYECDISGEVTIDELKKMIDSIQRG